MTHLGPTVESVIHDTRNCGFISYFMITSWAFMNKVQDKVVRRKGSPNCVCNKWGGGCARNSHSLILLCNRFKEIQQYFTENSLNLQWNWAQQIWVCVLGLCKIVKSWSCIDNSWVQARDRGRSRDSLTRCGVSESVPWSFRRPITEKNAILAELSKCPKS